MRVCVCVIARARVRLRVLLCSFMRGQSGGWGRKSPWCCHRRLLSDAAVVVVREYSAAPGAARRFPRKDASPRHGHASWQDPDGAHALLATGLWLYCFPLKKPVWMDTAIHTNHPSIHPPSVSHHTPIDNSTIRFVKFRFAAFEQKCFAMHVPSMTLLALQYGTYGFVSLWWKRGGCFPPLLYSL